MVRFLLTLITFACTTPILANPIILYDLTFKLCSNQIDSFYVNARKGDEIIIDISTNRKHQISEVVFNEYGNKPIFNKLIDNDKSNIKFNIPHDGIYCIKTISKKQIFFKGLMNIKIFIDSDKIENTTIDHYVYWKHVTDTIKFEETTVNRDTIYESIIDEKITIHSEMNPGNHNQIVKKILLPENTVKCNIVLSVGQEGQKELDKDLKKTVIGLSQFINPMAALFAPTFIDAINSGNETIKYQLSDSLNFALEKNNKTFYKIMSGEASSLIRTFNAKKNQSYYLKLINSSIFTAKNLTLKVNAMIINETTLKNEYRSPKIITRIVPYIKE